MPIANPYPLDYDLDKRRQWMDDHGDLMHCLTLSGAMPWQKTSPQDGAHLAQVINDTGIQVHEKYPDRFVIGIELPIRSPELSLKELNRVAGAPGVLAVHLPDSIERQDYIFDANFAPVLARIQELNYPIIFHQMDGLPNVFGGTRTAGPPPLASGIDAPIEHILSLRANLSILARSTNIPTCRLFCRRWWRVSLPCRARRAFPLSRERPQYLDQTSFP